MPAFEMVSTFFTRKQRNRLFFVFSKKSIRCCLVSKSFEKRDSIHSKAIQFELSGDMFIFQETSPTSTTASTTLAAPPTATSTTSTLKPLIQNKHWMRVSFISLVFEQKSKQRFFSFLNVSMTVDDGAVEQKGTRFFGATTFAQTVFSQWVLYLSKFNTIGQQLDL